MRFNPVNWIYEKFFKKLFKKLFINPVPPLPGFCFRFLSVKRASIALCPSFNKVDFGQIEYHIWVIFYRVSKKKTKGNAYVSSTT
jgi:hypothetical protein